jgi:peptidyl-prolyl cis-trans isomerase C
MFRLNNMIRAVCVTAFASVALGTVAPSFAHAADAPASTSAAGTVAIVNGVALPQSQLDAATRKQQLKVLAMQKAAA